MKLIVGLGNPDKNYENTYHNIGFMVVDHFINANNLGSFNSKFHSDYLKTKFNSCDVIFLKPLTYMNLSGKAVRACSDFFKISPSQILILCDDLDLPVGKARLRTQGGSGGHNGLKSITEQMSTNGYNRLRIGIGRPKNGKINISDYVLSKIDSDNQVNFNLISSKIEDVILNFITKNNIQGNTIEI